MWVKRFMRKNVWLVVGILSGDAIFRGLHHRPMDLEYWIPAIIGTVCGILILDLLAKGLKALANWYEGTEWYRSKSEWRLSILSTPEK